MNFEKFSNSHRGTGRVERGASRSFQKYSNITATMDEKGRGSMNRARTDEKV